MKLHLPVLLRKALLACFSFTFACTCSAAAADLTLGNEDSLTIDYADIGSIPDLENGTLRLNGDTILLLENCGEGDGKTYSLAIGVSGLVDAMGNPITLDPSNNAISHYFDTTQPGVGFWTDATLALTDDGTLQLVRHHETVKAAQTITTRQTESLVYSYYAGISFEDITQSSDSYAYGGAIYGNYYSSTITLSGNGSVTFRGNTASSSYAYGGAIYGYGSTIELSGNGSVEFSGNTASSSDYYDASGGAIYGGPITLRGNGSVTFSGDRAYSSGGAIDGSTITLSDNGSVEFSGNRAYSGGAIYGGTITLSGNGSVEFSGNTASSGGAIYGYGSTIELSGNGSVTFSGNTASNFGGAIYGYGGTITLSGNERVVFSENSIVTGNFCSGGAAVSGDSIILTQNGTISFRKNSAYGLCPDSSDLTIHGGAIFAQIVEISNNNEVDFSENFTKSEISADAARGGAIFCAESVLLNNNKIVSFKSNTNNSHGSLSTYSGGGAIYGDSGSVIALTYNDIVILIGNVASGVYYDDYHVGGGAIYGGDGSTIELNNNGRVTFCGNSASYNSSFFGTFDVSVYGGAVYAYGDLSIRNNTFVLFEKNVEKRIDKTYRLRSIYAGGSGDVISLSAAAGKSIEFRDSVYVASGSTVELNADYTDAEGVIHKQAGDIIFTGKYTEQHLNELLTADGLNRTATEAEILNSRTTEVQAMTNLYGGRLRVEDGAIYKGYGITAMENSAATVLVKDATLEHAGHDLVFHDGTILELKGKNSMSGNLSLQTDSTLSIHVDSSHQNNAALTLSGTLTLGDTVTLCLTVDDVLTSGQAYKLLTGISQPYSWDSSTVQVTSGTTGWSVDFNDLSWVDNTLWLNYNNQPALTIATWTNEAGNRLWDDASVNWEQNDYDYAYKDGVQVIFGDKAAGTVTLVGALSPASVLVNSSKDYIWNADATEGGSLTGSMKLTKDGSGKLTINTSNSYTGGTEIKGGILVANHVKALGEGAVALNGGTLEIGVSGITNTVKNIGNSTLSTSAGVTHALTGIISNSGTLSISGSIDASALALDVTEAGRVSLSGADVSLSESGFTRAAGYSVLIVEGGKTVNKGVSILHDDYRMRSELVLGEDGVARAGGGVDYSRFFLTGEDTVSVSEVDAVSESKGSDLLNVTMDGGALEVDADITVEASGGNIVITDDSTLRGAIAHADITAAAGDYMSDISAVIGGGSRVTVNGGRICLSGDNAYTGGTVINGGVLSAGSDTAFGTGDIVLNKGELNLNGKAAENALLANGGMIANGGAFRGSVSVNGSVGLRGNMSARSVSINSGSVLTLNGSTISVSGTLTLGGSAVLNLNGSDFGDGDVLITFGSLSGSEKMLTVDYGADSDQYSVEREGNALILAWLEETQPEEEPLPEPEPEMPQPETPAPVLDRESCDALAQSSWGVFTASHAFVSAVQGLRDSTGQVGTAVAWVSALGGVHRIEGTETCSGSDIDLYGAAFGLETQLTETDSIGFALGKVGGEVSLKQGGSQMEQDSIYLSVYGSHLLAEYARNRWLTLRWSAAYGVTDTEGTLGQEDLSLKQDNVQLNARLEWNSQLAERWTLHAFAGAEYFASGSSETGEEQSVRLGSIQNLRGEIGIGTRYASGSTTVYGEVRYLNDMVRSNPYADINGLRGYGANPGRQGIGVTLGAQQELGNGWSVHASYSLEAMSEATMHSANIGAALRF